MLRTPASFAGSSLICLSLAPAAQTVTPTQILGPVRGSEAPTLRALVLQGDATTGAGLIQTISNLAVNDRGEWIVEAATDAPSDVNDVVVKNGATFLVEGQGLPAPSGATLDTFDACTLNDAGNSAWNFFLDGTTGSDDDSGLYFDTTLLIQEDDLSGAVGFGSGTTYQGFFDVKLNDAAELLVLATVDDPTIAGTLEQAFLRATVSGGSLTSESVLLVEGDVPPGQSEPISVFSTAPHANDLNDAGEVMLVCDLAGSTSSDVVCYLNGSVLAQEGSPSPAAGRTWGLGTATTAVSLNDTGAWALRGSLTGPTSSNTLLVRDGAVVVQEGDSLPAIAPFTFTSLGTGPIHLGNDGTLAWYGEWSDPDGDVDSGLFLDDQLVVQEGVTVVAGRTIDTLRGVAEGFTMSPSGRYLLFEAILDDGTDGAFLLDRGLLRQPLLLTNSASNAILEGGPFRAGERIGVFGARRAALLDQRSLFGQPRDWHFLEVLLLDGQGRAVMPRRSASQNDSLRVLALP